MRQGAILLYGNIVLEILIVFVIIVVDLYSYVSIIVSIVHGYWKKCCCFQDYQTDQVWVGFTTLRVSCDIQ